MGYTHDANFKTRVEVWRLTAPPAGSNSVKVSLNGSAKAMVVGVTTYSGVDQTAPLGTTAAANGLTGNPTVQVASGIDELDVDTVARELPSTFAPGAGQTETLYGSNSNLMAAGSRFLVLK